MKLITLLPVLIAIQIAVCEDRDTLTNYHKECIKETGIDREVIDKAIKGEFAEHPQLKQQLLCVSKKIGIQSSEGEVQTDIVRAKLNNILENTAVVDKIITKCVRKYSTPEETAWQTLKCYYENTSPSISLV